MNPVDARYTIEALQAMVRIPSINPTLAEGGDGELAISNWLAQECQNLGFEVELQEAAPGRPNVIARKSGMGGGRSLMLTGHSDTVSPAEMVVDPFGAEIRDGRLYGRGSQDMKGGLASILGAAKALQGQSFRGDLVLAFVVDEEYASIGASALVESVRTDAAILTEPTDEKLCVAHKGFAWLTLETHGKAAHGSLFSTGIDAIVHMGRLIEVMEGLERDHFPRRVHSLLGRASVHASVIGGGIGLSTYPDHCMMQIEHRLLPDDSADDLHSLWQEIINRLQVADPTFRGEVSLDLNRPGYEINRDAPIVKLLHDVIHDNILTEPEYYGMAAWLDSAIIGRAGIPTVIYGPRGAGLHGNDEYVEVDSVVRCAQVIAEASARWLA